MKKIIILFAAIFTISFASAQQFNTTGNASATSTPGCYTLTNAPNQVGAVWNLYTIDLTQPFDVTLTFNFGNRHDTVNTPDPLCGGGGMSFIFQPSMIATLQTGYGMGFHGISPSLGILIDTHHYDAGDPPYDHISINKNGDESDTSSNELVSYTNTTSWPPADTNHTNWLTDGLDHLFRITWEPITMTLNVWFGTDIALPAAPTIAYTGDIINNIFSGNPNVYWGVAASTGSCWNIQSVCLTTVADFVCDSIICPGIPVPFFDKSISDTSIASWSWNFDDGSNSSQQNPVHTYNVPGTYTVNLTIYNVNGYFSIISHTVVVNPKPNVVTNIISGAICLGDTMLLTTAGANTYVWTPGGDTSDNILVVPQATTSYIVTGQNQFYCTNSDTVLVIVNPSPIAEFTLVADTTTQHHYYAVNNATGVPPLKYIWSWGDGTQDTIAYPSHTYDSAGYYKICLTITDSNGCTNTYCDSSYLNKSPNSIISVNVIPHGSLGINTNEISNQLKIYPNPAKEILTIETNANTEQKFEIINMVGQTVFTSNINKKATINTSAFANGVYVIKLYTDKETVVKKFIKE